MKKIVVAVAALLSITTIGFAQNNSLGKSDPQAKALLDKVSTKFKSLKSAKADFVLKIQGANNSMNDTKKGTAYLEGNKYRINIGNQQIYCNGKTTWTYSKDANEVQVNNYKPNNGTISPSSLFSNFYEKNFLYRLDGKATVNGKKVEKVEMTPLDKSKSFFKVNVAIDKSKKLIVQTNIFEKSGNQYIYEITDFKPNPKVDESLFTFNPKDHPGVDVVDLR